MNIISTRNWRDKRKRESRKRHGRPVEDEKSSESRMYKGVQKITKSKDPNERNERLICSLFRLVTAEGAPLESLCRQKKYKKHREMSVCKNKRRWN